MTANEIRALKSTNTLLPLREDILEIAAQLADLNEQILIIRSTLTQLLPDVQKAFAKLGKGFLGL